MQKFVPQIRKLDNQNTHLLQLSYTLSKAGHYDAALQELEKVQQPNHLELIYVHIAIGNIYLLRKQYSEALARFQAVNHLDPLLAQGYLKIGNVCLKQSKLEGAHHQFTQCLDLDPGSFSAHIGLGQVHMKQLEYAIAVQHFQTAQTLNSAAVLANVLLAEVYREAGDILKAISELESVIQLRPEFLLSYIRLGNLHLSQRNYMDALKLFKKAHALNQVSVEAKLGLAQSLIKVGELDAATQLIGQIRDSANPPKTVDKPPANLQIKKQSNGDASPLDLLFYAYALEEQKQLLLQAL